MVIGDNVMTDYGSGVCIGFEDYSKSQTDIKINQPEHSEYRVIVKFDSIPYPHYSDVLYFWRNQIEVTL